MGPGWATAQMRVWVCGDLWSSPVRLGERVQRRALSLQWELCCCTAAVPRYEGVAWGRVPGAARVVARSTGVLKPPPLPLAYGDLRPAAVAWCLLLHDELRACSKQGVGCTRRPLRPPPQGFHTRTMNMPCSDAPAGPLLLPASITRIPAPTRAAAYSLLLDHHPAI